MASVFKKGQEVTYISNWDSKGTVYFRHAVVYSCGKKQMILTDATTGEEMGRHFVPALGDVVGTFPRMTDEQAIAKCLETGAAIVAKERAHCERCLENSAKFGHGAGYDAAIQKDLAALHEPRATSYADALQAIKAK